MSISRVYRILRLITLLQSGRGLSADELSRELEISRRTVFRDLNMLELAHIPYHFDKQTGGYRIGEHFFLPPINFTIGEALAVLLLTGRLKGTSRLPLLSEGARAAVKIESALPSAVRQHVGTVIDNLSLSMPPVASHEKLDDTFETLSHAIAARRICRLVYISLHERKQLRLDVHPLRLLFAGRAWYVLAWTPRYRQVRTYKLGRIRKLTMLAASFEPPKDANVEDHMEGAWSMIPEGRFHDVRLHFSPKVASNVAEVRWHPSQEVKWNSDGSAEFSARVNGLGEIAWWVLGYGDQVRVLAPQQLRGRIAAAARQMLKLNGEEAPSAEPHTGCWKEAGV